MNSISQASQDIFVLTMTKYKKNGVYLEIGANCPNSFSSNTCLLYNEYDWTGLMVEYDDSFEQKYIESRPKSHYIINDASKIDYHDFLTKNNYPKNMDYLQIDLDVDNRSTLNVLEKLDDTVFNEYTFATVTFEHDYYRGDYFSTRNISREIFAKHGYVMIFRDVHWKNDGLYSSFEDWYVHPSLVDEKLMNLLKTDEVLFHEVIRERLLCKRN